MNRISKLFSLAVLALSLTAFSPAQTTTITASPLKISGYPISTGEVLITPVNSQGTPIPFADATGAQNGPESFACQIVAGAITGTISETGTVSGTCSVPDAAETTPANILYSFQVVDQSSGLKTSGDAYTIQAVTGVSGTSWALDHYGPPATTTNVAAVQASQGTSIPTSCTAPSVFTLLTGGGTFSGFYTCVGGVEVAVSGGNGAVSSVFGRTGGVTAQTGDYTVAQITGAAPLASPTFTGTPVVPGYETTTLAALLAPLNGVGTSGTWPISITGTASDLSGTPTLPNGTTGATQSVGDNSTKLATDAFVLANAGSGGGATSFSGLTGTATPAQLPAATASAQGAVQLPSGAGSNVLGSAAMTASTAYDAFGAATSAIATAEAYAANASNLSSGTVSAGLLPLGSSSAFGALKCGSGVTCTSGVISGGVFTSPTTGDLIASTATSGTVTTLHRVAAVFAFGDSYIAGIGNKNQYRDGYVGQFLRDTNVPVSANYGVGGTTMNQIAMSALANVYYAPSLPIVYLNDGGINDDGGDTCGKVAGTNCIKNFTLGMNALIALESIPGAFHVFASNATRTGTWTYSSGFPSGNAGPTGVAYGTNEQAGSSGATVTFSIPSSASTKVGLTYGVGNSITGTFSVSVDGTLQTDTCSGTTSFTSTGCGGFSIGNTGLSIYRQEFTVTAGTTHSIVVTSLSANPLIIIAADWIPPTTTLNLNPVFYVNAPTASNTLADAGTPVYNAAIASTISNFQAEGLPVFLVDVVGGTPGANTTADYATTSTTNCVASTTAGHPNYCGASDTELTILNTELINGYQVSSYNSGAGPSNAGVSLSPMSVNFGNANNYTPTWSQVTSQMNVGIYPASFMEFWAQGNNHLGLFGEYQDASSGNPWSGQFGSVLAGGACTYGSALFAGYDGSGSPGISHFTTVGSVQFCTGNTSFKGVDSRLIGTVASATTIAPTTYLTTITGSTTITTITTPANFSSTYGGCLQFRAASGTTATFATGGNIETATTIVGPSKKEACWFGTTWDIE